MEVSGTMEQAKQTYPEGPNGSVFYFVNVTHTIAAGQVYVFNGRLNGALWAYGYDHSITARRTFRLDDAKEHELVQKLSACDGRAPDTQSCFIYRFSGRGEGAGSCAEKVIAASEREAPELWR